jgi:Fe-S cluster assembly protein SufD
MTIHTATDSKLHYLQLFDTPRTGLKQEALARFEQTGFPHKRLEDWKYIDFQPLLRQELAPATFHLMHPADFEKYLIPGLDENVLVFLNGHFQPHLTRLISPERQIVIKNRRDMPAENSGQLLGEKAQSNGFVSFNEAFAEAGFFLQVPDNQTVAKPVVLYFISNAQTPAFTQIRNRLVAGKNSEVQFVEVFKGNNTADSLTNALTEIETGEKARVSYFKIQQEDVLGSHVGMTVASQQSDSYLESSTFTLGGNLVRNDLQIQLNGRHCETHMYGLYLPKGKQIVDNHTLVDHRQPDCESNELYKGILTDKATGVFNGKIFVRKDAQKTNAFQSNRSLVLSPEATMNTKPQLEIFADDVKCSHGAVVGQLDENQLFYLRARGIPQEQAKALLMLAFVQDVVDKLSLPALQTYLENEMQNRVFTM